MYFRPVTETGLSREVFNAVTANVESQEYQRCHGDKPEHPRAATTDDVENFFHLLHRQLGPAFTAKQFIKHWPMVVK
jgi:hypothetical protein